MATEFKPGQHWRPRKPHWDKDWLVREYVTRGRSTGEIAAQIGTTDANVLHWLRKHGIPRRSVSGARALKHWGLPGEANAMFGKRGALTPGWKGGCTPERQAFYASAEWSAVSRFVWGRDCATCRRCGHKQKNGERAIDIHHIISFAEASSRAEPSNLVLLCRPCHRFVHSRKNAGWEFLG